MFVDCQFILQISLQLTGLQKVSGFRSQVQKFNHEKHQKHEIQNRSFLY